VNLFSSKCIFESSKFEERNFIKRPVNRKILKEAAKSVLGPTKVKMGKKVTQNLWWGGNEKEQILIMVWIYFGKWLQNRTSQAPHLRVSSS